MTIFMNLKKIILQGSLAKAMSFMYKNITSRQYSSDTNAATEHIESWSRNHKITVDNVNTV